MGVLGLTTLIENNGSLLNNHLLADCRLIIDGLSLCHQLYDCGKAVDVRCGGDYQTFRRRCDAFFHTLASARVECLLVLDGSSDPLEAKFSTTLSRQQSRIGAVQTVLKYQHASLLPLLAVEELLAAARGAEVAILQCPGEADGVMASISRRWNCPVLSYDSDFFVFDIPGGYIPFKTLELDWNTLTQQTSMEVLSEATVPISCKRYLLSGLLDRFPSLDPALLPVFAVVAGNDLSNPLQSRRGLADAIHSSQAAANLPFVERFRNLKSINKWQSMLIDILTWLEQFKGVDAALETVCGKLKVGDRQGMKSAATVSVELYAAKQFDHVKHTADSDMRSDLEALYTAIEQGMETIFELPLKFIKDYVRSAVHPNIIFAILEHRRVILSTVIENFNRVSIHVPALALRRVFYRILTQSAEDDVTEYFRRGLEVKGVTVNLADAQVSGVVPIPQLFALEHQSETAARIFLCNLARLESSGLLDASPRDLRLFCLSLSYWLSETDNQFVHFSLVVSMLLYAFARSSDVNKDLLCFVDRFSFSPISAIPQQASRKRKAKSNNQFRVNDVHAFNQWQAVYQCLLWLNRLLSSPFSAESPSRLFNGRTVYNLAAYFAPSGDAVLERLPDLLIGCDCKEFVTFAQNTISFFPCERLSGTKAKNQSAPEFIKRLRREKNVSRSRNASVVEEADDLNGEQDVESPCAEEVDVESNVLEEVDKTAEKLEDMFGTDENPFTVLG